MQKYEMHGTKDMITLTMSTEVKKADTKCILGYRATKTGRMLPHQKLDEE